MHKLTFYHLRGTFVSWTSKANENWSKFLVVQEIRGRLGEGRLSELVIGTFEKLRVPETGIPLHDMAGSASGQPALDYQNIT